MSSVFAQYGAAVRSLNRSMRHPRHQAFVLSVVVTVVSGVVFYSLTEDWSIADSLYFTVVALTTIGFGDFTPTTTLSRLFTVVYAVIGVGLIGILVHLIVSSTQQANKHQGPASDASGN